MFTRRADLHPHRADSAPWFLVHPPKPVKAAQNSRDPSAGRPGEHIISSANVWDAGSCLSHVPRRTDATNNGRIKRRGRLDKWLLAGLSPGRWVVPVAAAANQ